MNYGVFALRQSRILQLDVRLENERKEAPTPADDAPHMNSIKR